jgi:hypothetical protein
LLLLFPDYASSRRRRRDCVDDFGLAAAGSGTFGNTVFFGSCIRWPSSFSSSAAGRAEAGGVAGSSYAHGQDSSSPEALQAEYGNFRA